MIEFGKVRFFREDRKKGWFGTTKYVNTHAQDRWRIYSIYLKPSGTLGFLSPAGQIRCKTCTWKIKGGSSVRWVSLGDVMKGKF